MARILIVDDEADLRDLIKDVLTPHGHQCTLVDGAKNALAVLHKEKFDVAIVDRNMVGLSGLDLVKLVKSNPMTKNVRVIMCTAASATKDIGDAMSAGVDDYILKPLNFPTLVGKVARVLTAPPKDKK